MKIGDELIRQITAAVDAVEDQFHLIELIDSYRADSSNPFELIASVSGALLKISNTAAVYHFFLDNDVVNLQYKTPTRHHTDYLNIIKSRIKSNPELKCRQYRSICFSTVELNIPDIPKSWIVLVDNYFGRKVSTLYSGHFSRYLEFLAEKLKSKITIEMVRIRDARHRELSERFLSKARPGSDDAIENDVSEGWDVLLEALTKSLPDWGPFAYTDELPRWQILTVEKGRKYLNLRAQSGESSRGPSGQRGGYRVVSTERRFEAAKTVSGICLERESEGLQDSYLTYNPRLDPECQKRYAAIMYPGDEIPESELVVPIRDKRDKIVAIVNLEHPKPHAFSEFQGSALLLDVLDIRTFAENIIESRRHIIDREKELRYMLLRVVNRLAKQYQHRTKNDFGRLISALDEAGRSLTNSNLSDANFEINEAKEVTDLLKDTTVNFNERARDFVKFGRRNLTNIIEKVVIDSKTDAANHGGEDKVIWADRDVDYDVFCSGFAIEHLYCIIQNSMEEFLNIRKTKDPTFTGRVEISVRHHEGELDNKGVRLSQGFADVIVSDNGGGVPTGARIFDPHVTLKEGGTGYGLPTARAYMRRLGGDVWLDEQYDGGASFVMRFPLYEDALHVGMAEQMNLHIEERESGDAV